MTVKIESQLRDILHTLYEINAVGKDGLGAFYDFSLPFGSFGLLLATSLYDELSDKVTLLPESFRLQNPQISWAILLNWIRFFEQHGYYTVIPLLWNTVLETPQLIEQFEQLLAEVSKEDT